jgi:hypothetical protein
VALLSQRAQGYVLYSEVLLFCNICNQWSSMGNNTSTNNKTRNTVDVKRPRERAQHILNTIGNSERATVQAFVQWMVTSYQDMYVHRNEQWRRLSGVLMNHVRQPRSDIGGQPRSSRGKGRPTLSSGGGGAGRGRGAKNVPAYWYYLDDNRHERGPYDTKTLVNWIRAGHLNETRLVLGVAKEHSSRSGVYIPINQARVLSKYLSQAGTW